MDVRDGTSAGRMKLCLGLIPELKAKIHRN